MHWSSFLTKIAFYYLITGILAGAYFISKFSVQRSRRLSDTPAKWPEKLRAYGICIFTVCVISFIVTAISTNGNEEEGIKPWSTQRQIEFNIEAFIFLLPAGLLGVFNAFDRDKRLTEEERKRLNDELIINEHRASKHNDW